MPVRSKPLRYFKQEYLPIEEECVRSYESPMTWIDVSEKNIVVKTKSHSFE
jgi:hypothetical protein